MAWVRIGTLGRKKNKTKSKGCPDLSFPGGGFGRFFRRKTEHHASNHHFQKRIPPRGDVAFCLQNLDFTVTGGGENLNGGAGLKASLNGKGDEFFNN